MNATMALDRQLQRGLRADVTRISRNNFFLFTPLLTQLAVVKGGRLTLAFPRTST